MNVLRNVLRNVLMNCFGNTHRNIPLLKNCGEGYLGDFLGIKTLYYHLVGIKDYLYAPD